MKAVAMIETGIFLNQLCHEDRVARGCLQAEVSDKVGFISNHPLNIEASAGGKWNVSSNADKANFTGTDSMFRLLFKRSDRGAGQSRIAG